MTTDSATTFTLVSNRLQDKADKELMLLPRIREDRAVATVSDRTRCNISNSLRMLELHMAWVTVVIELIRALLATSPR